MNKYAVYYTKPEHFRDFILGEKLPTFATIGHTHTFLTVIEATGLEDVFVTLQGENWSPNGEARELIQSLDLNHTSMSVGDVIVDYATDEWFVVSAFGFKKFQ